VHTARESSSIEAGPARGQLTRQRWSLKDGMLLLSWTVGYRILLLAFWTLRRFERGPSGKK
jgi:hypothetical protein